jgi:hypothetical protein
LIEPGGVARPGEANKGNAHHALTNARPWALDAITCDRLESGVTDGLENTVEGGNRGIPGFRRDDRTNRATVVAPLINGEIGTVT